MRDALEFLRQEFHRLSGKELNISSALTAEALNTRVSLTLDRMPILSAYEFLGKAAKLDVSVETFGLYIRTHQEVPQPAVAQSPTAAVAQPQATAALTEHNSTVAAYISFCRALYPVLSDKNSELGRQTDIEIVALTQTKDPVLYREDAPIIVAKQAAGKLGLYPANLSRPTAAAGASLRVLVIEKMQDGKEVTSIRGIAGVDPNGVAWKLSEADAIKLLQSKTYRLYVSREGHSVWVITATSRAGLLYLKTEADGESPDNLLSLPRLP